MIYKVSYTIDSEDRSSMFFTDRKNAKEDFLKRCHDLGVDKGAWEVSKLSDSLEYWKTKDFKVGDENFWLCVGVKIKKIKTRD